MNYKITAISKQMALKNLALYSDCEDATKPYFIYQALDLLRREIGDDLLKERFKERYEEINNKLSRIGIILEKVKHCYDFKEYNKEEIKEYMDKIALAHNLIYVVFYLYLSNSNLKDSTIPKQDFIRWRKYTPVKYQDQQYRQDQDENK